MNPRPVFSIVVFCLGMSYDRCEAADLVLGESTEVVTGGLFMFKACGIIELKLYHPSYRLN